MKRRSFIKTGTAAAVTWWIAPPTASLLAAQGAAPGVLDSEFLRPPASARPHTWWHWMNGNVTADGITRDLEAMARVGVGGVQMFDVGTGIPKGPVETLSPEWLRGPPGHELHDAQLPGLVLDRGPWIARPRDAAVGLTGVRGRGSRPAKLPRSSPSSTTTATRCVAPPCRVGESHGRRSQGRRQAGRSSPLLTGIGRGSSDPGFGRAGELVLEFAAARQVCPDPLTPISALPGRWRTRCRPPACSWRPTMARRSGRWRIGGGGRRRSRPEHAGRRQLCPSAGYFRLTQPRRITEFQLSANGRVLTSPSNRTSRGGGTRNRRLQPATFRRSTPGRCSTSRRT
jgi:hypothetical protein